VQQSVLISAICGKKEKINFIMPLITQIIANLICRLID